MVPNKKIQWGTMSLSLDSMNPIIDRTILLIQQTFTEPEQPDQRRLFTLWAPPSFSGDVTKIFWQEKSPDVKADDTYRRSSRLNKRSPAKTNDVIQ